MKLQLCKGEGNGVDQACLATAVAMLAGVPEAGDCPSCLCPVIREFVIPTNDEMPDDLRREYYGDLPWMLLGTATDDQDVMRTRAEMAVEFAQQFLWAVRDPDLRQRLTGPAGGRSRAAAFVAVTAAGLPPDRFVTDKEWGEDCWKYSKEMLCCTYQGRGHWDRVAPMCRDLVVRMATVGTKTAIEPVMTEDEIARALCRN